MILMNDFRSEPDELVQNELAAVERVLRSGWYILGNEVKDFEQHWATYCGAKFAVGVGNGMDAIEIGLRALGIGTGDEVITTAMTAFATVLAIMRAGAVPVLADIDPETALLDPNSVERCLSPRTKSVLMVHLYGQIRNMDHWTALCKRSGIVLLEDCAQSHAARWKGKAAGTFGAWGAYSFYPTKNLGAIGDGGMLITDSSEIAEKSRILRNYGQSQRYYHSEAGLNSRLDEMQAAILNVRLSWLDIYTRRRGEIAQVYSSGIENPYIQKMTDPLEWGSHVYHLYVIRCDARDRLAVYLQERGISSLIHYPIPIHHQGPCLNVRIDPKGLWNAEQHALRCLSLPCHPQMSDNDLHRVIEAINEFK
ncbi:MAG TPA: DegT/DnrJ/EryC1/StrS family aminotransferase [Nitrospirota bacterium]|nr:DegT/DnrJ/EryC1/StrS family aminotransferase [Nitrospirota bacterium]HUL01205.1 DegT/DnrJ/EryC1/StrS family aminotransferase [Nitrospirota bacterium]